MIDNLTCNKLYQIVRLRNQFLNQDPIGWGVLMIDTKVCEVNTFILSYSSNSSSERILPTAKCL